MRRTQLLLAWPLLLVEPALGGPSPAAADDASQQQQQQGARQQQLLRNLANPIGSVVQGIMESVDSTTATYVGECDDDNKCGVCQGDCDSDDDCQGMLRCYFRESPYVAVPGCIGAEGEFEETDYCYMPPFGIGPDVQDNGMDWCEGGGCGLCEGDCDFDDDCKGTLKCFQRHYSHTDVPGCYGASFVEERTDFCYQPPPPAKDEVALTECSPDEPCPKCRGDCDSDDDCEGDLICFWREQKYMPVPGCRNGHDYEDPIDFCYDPNDDIFVRSVGCDSDYPCDKCRGDCDSDEDCKEGLICRQREIPYQLVPGCEIGTDTSTDDYCYDPANEEGGESNYGEPDKGDWPDWYYTYDLNDGEWGPSNWDTVDVDGNEWEKFDDLDVYDNECDGDDQSPINLNTVNEECLETHHIYYFPGMTDEMNAGGLVEYAITPYRLRINFEKVKGIDPPQIDPPGGVAGGITKRDANHVEYMEPSEHMIGGKRFDGEFRIMHAQKSWNKIIGVAMMVEVSYEHNPYFEVILRKWEQVDDCGNGNGRWDIEMDSMEVYNIVSSMYFWAYYGSLTEPPCSPIVQWRVLDTPVRISKEQKERTSRLLTDGGPCRDHPLRQAPQQNGGARPIQRDGNDAKVWRCTINNYMWEDGDNVI